MTLALYENTGTSFALRRAEASDLDAIIALLADDRLGAGRENADDRAPYERAFAAIDADDAQLLLVVTDAAAAVVGTMQLTVMPGLSSAGATRLQVEAVRVHSGLRGQGIGGWMIEWAVAEAARRGASMVQLTSHASRADAHRFYERLGFEQSHVGFKKYVG